MPRPRILTGIRPTGRLHLGHLVGALENWVRLQEEYDCYFLLADYQALGDHSDDVERIRWAVREVAIDWLSVGLDPERSSFVIQSYVPEHAELAMLLSMLVPVSRLDRNPTLKTELARLRNEGASVTAGFYTYPISQAADVLLPRAEVVPVGDDQLPHLELTRFVARTFNRRYGTVFPEPRALLGRVPRLVGTDGRAKMSTSLGNVIDLADSRDVVRRKVHAMFTDPTRIHPSDPGHVEGNPVFMYLDAFDADREGLEALKVDYRRGGVRDVDVKDRLYEVLERVLEPIRERRAYVEQHPALVADALHAGTTRERGIAAETMGLVRDAMRISSYERAVLEPSSVRG